MKVTKVLYRCIVWIVRLGYSVVIVTLLWCVVLIFTGGEIGPGMCDFSYDVADGYILAKTSAHQVEVCPNRAFSPDEVYIKPKVVEIAWDKRFVVAKQYNLNPNYLTDFYLEHPEERHEAPVPDLSRANYWILDASIPKLYGPFDKSEFERERESLSVPSSLVLKRVSSYKKQIPRKV